MLEERQRLEPSPPQDQKFSHTKESLEKGGYESRGPSVKPGRRGFGRLSSVLSAERRGPESLCDTQVTPGFTRMSHPQKRCLQRADRESVRNGSQAPGFSCRTQAAETTPLSTHAPLQEEETDGVGVWLRPLWCRHPTRSTGALAVLSSELPPFYHLNTPLGRPEKWSP